MNYQQTIGIQVQKKYILDIGIVVVCIIISKSNLKLVSKYFYYLSKKCKQITKMFIV